MTKPEFDIKSLPANLKPIGEKLQKLGYAFFKMPQLGPDIFGLSLPPLPGSNRSPSTTIVPRSAMRMLLTEAIRCKLMLKMANPDWGNRIYGRGADFSRVKVAGCGPIALAIIMNYLLRTYPSGSKIGPIDRKPKGESSELKHYENTKDLVVEIIRWAGANPSIRPGPDKNGKLRGTSDYQLAKKLTDKFQGFGAELIKNNTTKVVNLLKNGNLLMVAGRQRGWSTRDAFIKNPNKPDAKEYKGHFVVLWGADHSPITIDGKSHQILWVLDPAVNSYHKKAIRYTTLNMHQSKTFIRIYRSRNENLIDCLLPHEFRLSGLSSWFHGLPHPRIKK